MEKLQITLADLQLKNEYVSNEIEDVEQLMTRVSDSVETHQESILEIQNKALEIAKLKQEEQNLFIKIEERIHEFDLAMKMFEDLQIEYENLKSFDENQFGAFDKDKIKNLENQLKLFGIEIEAHYIEPTAYQAKIVFSENRFVIFNYDFVENTYDLQLMQPTHTNFEEIRKLLLESGDIVGFMCHVRTFLKQKV